MNKTHSRSRGAWNLLQELGNVCKHSTYRKWCQTYKRSQNECTRPNNSEANASFLWNCSLYVYTFEATFFLSPLVWLMSVRSSQLLRVEPLESPFGYAGSAESIFLYILRLIKQTCWFYRQQDWNGEWPGWVTITCPFWGLITVWAECEKLSLQSILGNHTKLRSCYWVIGP